jgi:hypothetical protein
MLAEKKCIRAKKKCKTQNARIECTGFQAADVLIFFKAGLHRRCAKTRLERSADFSTGNRLKSMCSSAKIRKPRNRSDTNLSPIVFRYQKTIFFSSAASEIFCSHFVGIGVTQKNLFKKVTKKSVSGQNDIHSIAAVTEIRTF